MSAYIHVDGVQQLVASLDAIDRQARAELGREVMRTALAVQAGAKRGVPVDTGRLRNSIAVARSDDGLSAEVGTNVQYARRIEFGFIGADRLGRRYHQRPRPYLFPALEAERAGHVQRVTGVLRRLGQGRRG